MEIRIVWRSIAGLILSGFVFVLSACGTISTHPTDVRNLPDEVKEKLSVGDTRQKVRSILGDPLVDAQSHGVEVYRLSGRDLAIILVPVPVPFPGQKVIAVVLVVYDENDKVKDIVVDSFEKYHHTIEPEDISEKHFSFKTSAGVFHFVNSQGRDPETLLGPSISWEELTTMEIQEGSCSLVLVMGECPMEKVSLDNKLIADISPAGLSCVYSSSNAKADNYYGTFIRKFISSGKHRLNIRQETMVNNRDFIADIKCESGETVYAILDTIPVRNGWSIKLDGKISLSTQPTENIIEIGVLHPILWHRGSWYGPPTSHTAGSQ